MDLLLLENEGLQAMSESKKRNRCTKGIPVCVPTKCKIKKPSQKSSVGRYGHADQGDTLECSPQHNSGI